jgi:PAS domain S-box-containing protein
MADLQNPNHSDNLDPLIAVSTIAPDESPEVSELDAAWLSNFICAAPVGIAILDRQLRYLQANAVLAEINGRPVAAHFGKTVTEVVPNLVEQQRAVFEQVLLTGQSVLNFEVHGETPSQPGVCRSWIASYFPLYSGDPQPSGIGILVLENTAQQAAEQALRQSEERYRSLVVATSQVVWSTDASGQVVTPTPSWSAYTGQTITESQGWGWLVAIHPDDREHTAAAWRWALSEQQLYQVEYRLRRSDGVYRYMAVRGAPVLAEDGSLREWVGLCTDITAAKRDEIMRQQSEAVLADKARKEHFLAEVSRELTRSLDSHAILGSVVRLAVPAIADWCTVVVEADGVCQLLEVAHTDPAKVQLAWDLHQRYPDRTDTNYGVLNVIRTGQSELVSQIAADGLEQVAQDAQHLEILQSLNLKSYLAVPMVARGRTLGALTLVVAESDRTYTQADLDFAEDLAQRTALAVDNARLFQAMQQELGERTRAEAELRESEARFRTMADGAPMLLWMAGTDTRGNFFNQSWLNFTGRSLEEEMGQGWAEGIHPDDCQRCWEAYLRAFDRQQPFELEYRRRRADGEYRWLLDRGTPRFLPNGSFSGYIGSCIDITDRKQDRDALQARADELARTSHILAQTAAVLDRRNQELDQFAYVVSHDLKAPLRAIANLSQWLEEDLEASLTDETRHQMSLLRGRVHRMEGLINGLLQYSRIGRVPEQLETIALSDLLREVIDSQAPPPEFTIELAPDLPTVRTNRLLLEQVFANLISNAVKHHDRLDGRIQITGEDQGDRYEFRVADDGPGIDPQFHSKIFGIFQTLEARDKVENTGIGLALVKKMVESQRGTVQIDSILGQGATFRFTWLK